MTHPKHFREHTQDVAIFQMVMRGEYGPIAFAGKRVLDVGAHIGGFSVLAALSGASRVHAFEANEANHALLSKNCEGLRAVCHLAAVWRSDTQESLVCKPSRDPQNTGGGGVVHGASELKVLGLDEILKTHGPFDVLKLDCEGAEIPILLTSKNLQQIPVIVGEYHPTNHMNKTTEDVFHKLRSAGYSVVIKPTVGGFGIFSATRPKEPALRRWHSKFLSAQ
jgi:FkbM family methyltransferase